MKRFSILLTVALLGAPASAAAAQPEVVVPTPPERLGDLEVAEMTKLLRAARGVSVVHDVRVRRPAPFTTRVPCRVETRLARFEHDLGAARVEDVLGMLNLDRLPEAARQPRPLPCARDTLPLDRATFTFLTTDETVEAEVDLRGGGCRFSWRGKRTPRMHLGLRTQQLVQLLAEWVPGDSLLTDVRPCTREKPGSSRAARVAALAEPDSRAEPPVAVKIVRPEYPPSALSSKSGALVHCMALVAEDGALRELLITESSSLYDETVALALEQWEFEPARRRDKPIESWLLTRFRFEPQPAWPAPLDKR